MSLIRAKLVGDVVSGSTFAGIVTATGFDGDLVGNVTGSLSGIAATSVFAIEASYAANAGIASTSLASATAHQLTGKPNLDVGIVTATSFIGNGADLSNLNADNLTSGTVATARLASGTANSSSYLRGDQTWAAVPSGGFSNMQVFTSPGTFTVPPTTTKVKATVTGGGAGVIITNNQSGGPSGGTGIAVANVTPGSSISVVVGAGGGINGSGGSSSFGGFVGATGGTTFTGGDVSFGGSLQSALSLPGGNGSGSAIPITGTTPANLAGAASYWGSAGTTGLPGGSPKGSYGAGGGYGPGIVIYSGRPGVVVVEW